MKKLGFVNFIFASNPLRAFSPTLLVEKSLDSLHGHRKYDNPKLFLKYCRMKIATLAYRGTSCREILKKTNNLCSNTNQRKYFILISLFFCSIDEHWKM